MFDQYKKQAKQFKRMKQTMRSSPKILKKTQTFSTSNLNKQTKHLPSRYAHEKTSQKNQMITILNTIQSKVKSSQTQKTKPSSPSKLKLKDKIIQSQKKSLPTQFISKPLKRQQSDFQQFKEIFINPIEQNLDALKHTRTEINKNEITKEYQRLLEFQNGTNKRHQYSQETAEMNQKEVKQHYQEAIKLLQTQVPKSRADSQQDFYQQQIRIQPPDLPNSSSASTLSPGSGYAPSIPLSLTISKQTNLHQLLIRAKAGMNTQDIQKEAHLSFYLGIVYEEQRNYVAALKFYRRYLGFAKGMEDRIGMALGANRVAINFYYNHDIPKSIVFHNENLKLSDNENCFAGFYNLGICHRKAKHYDEAIQYFQTALQWATQNGQAQSQCITLGQMGVTYKNMQLYQKSLQNFQKSLQYCQKLKKTKLQAKNLMNILLISSQYEFYNEERIHDLTCQAYECAKTLGDKRLQQIFAVNLGIIKGKIDFREFVEETSFEQDYQEI